MTTVYDKLAWHDESAINAGQPAEHAFTHIGLYLAWLIRHDLHNPDFIRTDWAASVKAGEMTGSDLADAIDGTLASDAMTPEGQAFSDAYYETYVKDYEEAFGVVPDYGVPDDAASYGQVAPFIDRRYRAWVEEGRPAASPAGVGEPSGPRGMAAFGPEWPLTEEQLSELEKLLGESGFRVQQRPSAERMPHEALDLEELLAQGFTDPPMETSSVRASVFASSLVNRALKRLGVQTRDAYVAVGMGGGGQQTLTVTLYGVPGASASRLQDEFKTAIGLPTKGRWARREVAGKQVNWADGQEFTAAFWALDGLVLHVAAPDSGLVEKAIAHLP